MYVFPANRRRDAQLRGLPKVPWLGARSFLSSTTGVDVGIGFPAAAVGRSFTSFSRTEGLAFVTSTSS